MKNRLVDVAEIDSIPIGRMARFLVDDTWILIANFQGDFYAIADTCSHEDASLSKGVLKDGCVRCPLHGSRFDLKTGIPLEDPAEEPVDTYKVHTIGSRIFIASVPDRQAGYNTRPKGQEN